MVSHFQPAYLGTMLQEMSGKTVLITGSTDGVGRHVALKLAEAGAQVLIHGRSQDRADQLLQTISRLKKCEAVFYRADLSSLSETRRLAESVLHNHQHLDVLINNAGIGTGSRTDTRKMSQDGYELRFAVNYLAGFLLTRLLLDRIRASAPARIVNVSSIGQQPLDFEDLMLEHTYSGIRAYCQSKLAQVLFTFDLACELEGTGVIVNCLHPATYMNTTMVRESGVSPVSSVEEGAEAILSLAASPGMEGRSGLYFDGKKPSRANAQAYNLDARERLRTLSYQHSGLPSLTSDGAES